MFSAKAARTGASLSESFLTCEWQFMQVVAGGTAAFAARSTVVWQYRQSMPSSPACSAWLYGTG